MRKKPDGPEAVAQHNRQDILQALSHLALGWESEHFRTSNYFVIGGANLVLRGVRETTPDVDILVSKSLFKVLCRNPGAVLKRPPYPAMKRGANNPSVVIAPEGLMPVSATDRLGDGRYPLSFSSHFHETEFIDDVRCLRLPHVIASKVAQARPRDIEDIALVAEHLRSQA